MHPFTRQLVNEYAVHPANAVAAGTNLLVGATALGDLAFGQSHAFNSGEIPQNMLVAGFVPVAGSMMGAAIGGLGHMGRARMKHRSRPANEATLVLRKNDDAYNYSGRDFQPTRDINPSYMARDLAIGGAIGTAASAVPAIGYMINDGTQEPQTLGQALSMKDRAELNDLLDTHSDGGGF